MLEVDEADGDQRAAKKARIRGQRPARRRSGRRPPRTGRRSAARRAGSGPRSASRTCGIGPAAGATTAPGCCRVPARSACRSRGSASAGARPTRSRGHPVDDDVEERAHQQPDHPAPRRQRARHRSASCQPAAVISRTSTLRSTPTSAFSAPGPAVAPRPRCPERRGGGDANGAGPEGTGARRGTEATVPRTARGWGRKRAGPEGPAPFTAQGVLLTRRSSSRPR